MSKNEDHPMRGVGEFTPQLKASLFNRGVDRFKDFVGYCEKHDSLGTSVLILGVLGAIALCILTIVGTVDLWHRFVPPGHQIEQELQECTSDLQEARHRVETYESFIMGRALDITP